MKCITCKVSSNREVANNCIIEVLLHVMCIPDDSADTNPLPHHVTSYAGYKVEQHSFLKVNTKYQSGSALTSGKEDKL